MKRQVKKFLAYILSAAMLMSVLYLPALVANAETNSQGYEYTVTPEDESCKVISDYEFRKIEAANSEGFDNVVSYNFTPAEWGPQRAWGNNLDEFRVYKGTFEFSSKNGKPITDIEFAGFDTENRVTLEYSSDGVNFYALNCDNDPNAVTKPYHYETTRRSWKHSFYAGQNVKYVRFVINNSSPASCISAGLTSLSYNTADAYEYTVTPEDDSCKVISNYSYRKIAEGKAENFVGVVSYNFTPADWGPQRGWGGNLDEFRAYKGTFEFSSKNGKPITDIELVGFYTENPNEVTLEYSSDGVNFYALNCDNDPNAVTKPYHYETTRRSWKHSFYAGQNVKYVRFVINYSHPASCISAGLTSFAYNTAAAYEYTVTPEDDSCKVISNYNYRKIAEGNAENFVGVVSYNFTPADWGSQRAWGGYEDKFKVYTGTFEFSSKNGKPITDIELVGFYTEKSDEVTLQYSSDGVKYHTLNCNNDPKAVTKPYHYETTRRSWKHSFSAAQNVKYVRFVINYSHPASCISAGLTSFAYNTAGAYEYTVTPDDDSCKVIGNYNYRKIEADNAEGFDNVVSYNFTPADWGYSRAWNGYKDEFKIYKGTFEFSSKNGKPITDIELLGFYTENPDEVTLEYSSDGVNFYALGCNDDPNAVTKPYHYETTRRSWKHSFYAGQNVKYVRFVINYSHPASCISGFTSLSYNTADAYKYTVTPEDDSCKVISNYNYRKIAASRAEGFAGVVSYNFTPADWGSQRTWGGYKDEFKAYKGTFEFNSKDGKPITDIELVGFYTNDDDETEDEVTLQYSSDGVHFYTPDCEDDPNAVTEFYHYAATRRSWKYSFKAGQNIKYIRFVINNSHPSSCISAGLTSLAYNTADSVPVADEDINDDGKVNILDLIVLKKITVGINPNGYLGDLNNDGDVDAEDLIILRKYLLNMQNPVVVEKKNGISYIDDELADFGKTYAHGKDLALDSYVPSMFLGDDTRVIRANNMEECWMVWKLEEGISDAGVVIFTHKDWIDLEVSVSKDGETWEKLPLPTPTVLMVTDEEWRQNTYKFNNIDPANKYLKVDMPWDNVPAYDPETNIGNPYFPNLGRVVVNNNSILDDPDYLAEDREAATYYVDAIYGLDNNDGTSEQTAFRSLDKVSSKYFQAGDKILFKSGQTFYGTLKLKGQGADGNEILVGTYGGNKKAKIMAKGDRAVTLKSQYITVENLEISNSNGINGIYIMPFTTGANKNITIRNCYIHDIDTKQAHFANRYISSGISVNADGSEPTWFDGVTIENNVLEDISRVGIIIGSEWAKRPGTFGHEAGYDIATDTNRWAAKNVVIRSNTITRAYGDSIMTLSCDGAVVEKNTSVQGFYNPQKISVASAGIWTWGSNDNVLQYNEVAFHQFPEGCNDGEAYDIDVSEKRAVLQYNYSHDNEGGFLLMCNDYNFDPNKIGGDKISCDAVVRFNLSLNDGNTKKYVWAIDDVNPGTMIYNNTTYISSKNVKAPIGHWQAPSEKFTFVNNIFAGGPDTKFDWSGMKATGIEWTNNGAKTAWPNSKFNNNIMYNVNYDSLKNSGCGLTFSGNITNKDPKFKNQNLDTAKATRAQAIDAFTPTNQIRGAVNVPNNGGKDIAGNTFTTIDFFGCVKY